MIRSLKVCQKHLIPKAWFRIADTIVDERLEHKHLAKDKSLDVMGRDKHATAAACLKIVANAGIFGKWEVRSLSYVTKSNVSSYY